ncbi:hypothetical protein Pmani_021364 [Petrolisthes manimaculis]|uniref:Uncharacterized protein n=1 Tax=Petrolisthes manimaculis TaxID=1843537 RepID=A0AAE1PDZ7_9EUCA|nr:hypothetical protein Pmani_021364 [Petrolisthes manimaculis]
MSKQGKGKKGGPIERQSGTSGVYSKTHEFRLDHDAQMNQERRDVGQNSQVLITKVKRGKEWKDLVIFPSRATLDTLLTQRPSRREWSQDTKKWLQHLRQRALASLPR